MDPQAPAELRFLICATAGSPESGDDIQNIIPNPLPDGAHCYVISRRACFVLNKFSTATPTGVEVLATALGSSFPGRWVLDRVAAGAAPPVEAFATNPNTFVTNGVLNQPATALFSLDEGENTALWGFTASGCVLTYNGPATPGIATLTACVQVDNADAVRQVLGFVSVDNDVPAFGAGTTVAGVQAVTLATTTEQKIITAQRLVTLAPGATFRPKFGSSAGAVGGVIATLQLIVRPI